MQTWSPLRSDMSLRPAEEGSSSQYQGPKSDTERTQPLAGAGREKRRELSLLPITSMTTVKASNSMEGWSDPSRTLSPRPNSLVLDLQLAQR